MLFAYETRRIYKNPWSALYSQWVPAIYIQKNAGQEAAAVPVADIAAMYPWISDASSRKRVARAQAELR